MKKCIDFKIPILPNSTFNHVTNVLKLAAVPTQHRLRDFY